MSTEIATVDFETEAIEPRPYYPPKPVGVSVKLGSAPSEYFAWGHPTGNNCTFEEARNRLGVIWSSGVPLLGQNMKFDCDVAETHMGLPFPHWSRIHDTQFLIYLFDVHAKNFSLKPSAERILNWPPEEQDRLRDWVLANVPGVSTSKKSDRYWAKYICLAPGDLVGEYAKGDTDRTYALWKYLFPYCTERGMGEAYDRERELMPYLLGAERHGIRTDWERMESDYHMYQQTFAKADDLIREMLGAPDSMNPGSGAELADWLLRSGKVTALPRTATGRPSTAKDALQSAVEDPALLGLLRYRGVLKTCLGTFLGPWVAQANANKGRIHTQWHQTRGDDDKGGTVTGRLSSIGPNFMNVPNDFSGIDVSEFNLPPLPQMRSYLLPDEGHIWLKRDYSQQEVRVLGHFEDGALMQAFINDPTTDAHVLGAEVVRRETGHVFERSFIKQVVFSILYGSGVNSLAAKLGVPYWQAAQVREIYLSAFPDVRALMEEIKRMGKRGQPVRTTGGRILYCEPPKDGRDFSYKLLNHLIQGSSADITKESIRRYSRQAEFGVFLATVHDENNISAPEEHARKEMRILRECMHSVELDVPLTSSAYVGTSWHDADKNKLEGAKEEEWLAGLG